MEKNELGPYLIPYTNIKSKYVTELNVIAKSKKPLKGNIGENIQDTGLGNSFLDMTSKKRKHKQQKKSRNIGLYLN